MRVNGVSSFIKGAAPVGKTTPAAGTQQTPSIGALSQAAFKTVSDSLFFSPNSARAQVTQFMEKAPPAVKQFIFSKQAGGVGPQHSALSIMSRVVETAS